MANTPPTVARADDTQQWPFARHDTDVLEAARAVVRGADALGVAPADDTKQWSFARHDAQAHETAARVVMLGPGAIGAGALWLMAAGHRERPGPQIEPPRSDPWHIEDLNTDVFDESVVSVHTHNLVEGHDWFSDIVLDSPPNFRKLGAILRESIDRVISSERPQSNWHRLPSLLRAIDAAHDDRAPDPDPRILLEQIRSHALRTHSLGRAVDEVAADRRLRAALRQAQVAEHLDSRTDWAAEVTTAVYKHRSVAVGVIRRYWREGLLRGELLSEALEELGYVDEKSSSGERRSLLVDALSEDDPDVRYAAAQGLVYLADRAVLRALLAARAAEQNSIVRAQMDDAIRSANAAHDVAS